MSKDFEIIDSQETKLGTITLQRRRVLLLGGVDVFEVKLNEEWLMSSLFHDAEIALADLGLATQKSGSLDVVVGGLGLGYTAMAALKNHKVSSLVVVETLKPVISWHQQGKVPLGLSLNADPRCRLIEGDFFALSANPQDGFDPLLPGRKFHAILLDIDHSPSNFLILRHGSFYEPAGLKTLGQHLLPGGVFALWSNDPPESKFMKNLSEAFTDCRAEEVAFYNPLQNKDSFNTIYLARGPRA